LKTPIRHQTLQMILSRPAALVAKSVAVPPPEDGQSVTPAKDGGEGVVASAYFLSAGANKLG
jgi:hypothetical protein